MNTFKQQIRELASQGRRYYSELSFAERKILVAAMLLEQETLWKASVLVDADYDTALPNLVAESIATNGDAIALKKLFSKFVEIFVTGSQEKEAYFASDIESALEEQSAATITPVTFLEDLRKEDAAERARDMQKQLKAM